MIAAYLASHGIDAVDMELPLRGRRLPPAVNGLEDLHPSLDMVVKTFQQSVEEVCSLATTLVGEGYQKIGICGISIGALFASIAFGTGERLQCACLTMAGGNVAALIQKSRDALAAHLRGYIEEKGIPWDTVPEIVKPVDPLNFADPSKKDSLLMITATRDRIIRHEEAEQLWKAWGMPRKIEVRANHYSILKNAPYLLREAHAHFLRHLG